MKVKFNTPLFQQILDNIEVRYRPRVSQKGKAMKYVQEQQRST